MKTITLTFLLAFAITQTLFAQWTTSGSNIYFNTGNVGIGTSSPTSPLYISTAAASKTVALFSLDGQTSAPKMLFQVGSDGTHNGAPIAITTFGRGGGTEDMRFETSNWSGEYTWGYLSQSGGMKVVANIGTSGVGSTGQSDFGRFTLYSVNDSQGGYLSGRSAGTPHVLIDANPANTTYFDAGSVGIGTPTVPSGYEMAVKGSLIATGITVQTYSQWPDYVFKEAFHLPTLSYVENYIKLNSRLPEMPSAAEIEKKGIDLGDMDRVLTKKVEELTLYLIDKDNQLKTDEAKLTAQQERLDKLEKAFQSLQNKGK